MKTYEELITAADKMKTHAIKIKNMGYSKWAVAFAWQTGEKLQEQAMNMPLNQIQKSLIARECAMRG